MRQAGNLSIVNLIDPETDRSDDEKHGELNDDGEHEDDAIRAADGQRRPDSFERLPPKRLKIAVSRCV